MLFRSRGAPAYALIAGYGLADEAHALGSDTPSAGAGLCEAVRQTRERAARDGSPRAPSTWVVSDQNGERHRAKEWALTVTRLHALLAPEIELWRPAENFGDTGPATVPLLAAMVVETLRRDRAPAPEALLLASSDGPTRAGVLLRAPNRKD